MKKIISIILTFIIITVLGGWLYAGYCFEKKVQELVATCNHPEHISCSIVHMQKWLFQATCDCSVQPNLQGLLDEDIHPSIETDIQVTCHIAFKPWQSRTDCSFDITFVPPASANQPFRLRPDADQSWGAQAKIKVGIQHPSWWGNLGIEDMNGLNIHLLDVSIQENTTGITLFDVKNILCDITWSLDHEKNMQLGIDWNARNMQLKSDIQEVQDYLDVYAYRSEGKSEFLFNYLEWETLLTKSQSQFFLPLSEKLAAGELWAFAALPLVPDFQIKVPSMVYIYDTAEAFNQVSLVHRAHTSTVINYHLGIHYQDNWCQQVKKNWPVFIEQFLEASANGNDKPLFSAEISSPLYADAFIPYRDSHTQEQLTLSCRIQPYLQKISGDFRYQLNDSSFQIEGQMNDIDHTASGQVIFQELEPLLKGLASYSQGIIKLVSPEKSHIVWMIDPFAHSFIQQLGQKTVANNKRVVTIDLRFDFNSNTGYVGPYDIESLKHLLSLMN